MSNYYVGSTPENIIKDLTAKYLYGLRRTDDGELFLGKLNQMSKDDSITINNPGNQVDNFPNFEEGQDFFEGRDVKHNTVYKNLNYEQFRWDDRNIYYYVDDEGQLVARVNQKYIYDENSSSTGL